MKLAKKMSKNKNLGLKKEKSAPARDEPYLFILQGVIILPWVRLVLR
ncbi:MAG TPA: hypothetical protein VM577_16465 [Anaerovoracaceae bacterium]|nr:hypothetical protein [Anaerovoracaceae bacterium]